MWRAAAAIHPPEFVADHSDDFVRELRNGATVSFIEAWLELRRDPESRAGLWSRGPGAEFRWRGFANCWGTGFVSWTTPSVSAPPGAMLLACSCVLKWTNSPSMKGRWWPISPIG